MGLFDFMNAMAAIDMFEKGLDEDAENSDTDDFEQENDVDENFSEEEDFLEEDEGTD